MNATVIHNDNRVRGWIWLHIVEKALNEMGETLDAERALNDFTVHNTVQRKGWKD